MSCNAIMDDQLDNRVDETLVMLRAAAIEQGMALSGERLREVKAQEEQARRRAAHDAALVERDKLAAELAEVYPPLVEKLADLAGRITANDAVIERVNRKLPDSSKWIGSAELIARKLRNFNDGTADIPRITRHMRLPAFKYAALDPYAWPRPR